ncbi:MAG: NERD domain-containing protein [Acidobacteriota bacterium]|nr:NERD domain-containing protein [Acidobacteriota bacterium]
MRTRDRIGIEPRRQARRRTQRVLLTRPVLLAGVALVGLVVAVFVGGQALLSLTGHGWSPTVFGFLLGAAVVSVPWTLWTVIITVDGSLSWRVGAVAERRTAEVLSRLGPQWRFRYNVVFYDGRIDRKRWVSDIDCVATGPTGILAVSTKWTSDEWDLANPADEWLLAAARVAANNARRLAGPIRHVLRRPPPIIPMVVCWGPQIEPIPTAVSRIRLPNHEYGDVRVVSGYQAEEWLPLLAADRLDADEVDRVDQAVADWIDEHEDRHRRTREARELVARLRRWSAGLTGLSAAVALACTATLVAAVFSRPVLHFLVRLDRLGGGAGAAVYVLLPLGLPVCSAVVAHRVRSRSRDARLDAPATPVVASLAAAIMWTAAVAAVSAFA